MSFSFKCYFYAPLDGAMLQQLSGAQTPLSRLSGTPL